MLVTYYDCYNVLNKVYGSGAYIKQALLDTPIEPLNRPAITKICYGVLDKDIELSYIIKKFCDKTPKLVIRTLLKIGFYAIKYLKTAPHAVTDALVELSKKLGKGGTSGFINAVLRKFIREGVELPSGNDARSLSVRYSCPEYIVKSLLSNYGEKLTVDFLSEDEEYTFVRFNSGIDGVNYLEEKGVSYEKTPYSDTFRVKSYKMDEDFYLGVYTFQSVGSVAIASVASGGEKLLDCCSAPGGKSVYLASKYREVIATELHAHRVELITAYAERMGKSNVMAIKKDATVYDGSFERAFDTVLCDAPCSGSGVLKQNPDSKLNKDTENVKELSTLQLKILNNVKNYVKIGGELIYSTCSVLKEENDTVVKKFLDKNDNYKLVEIQSPLNHIKTKFGLQFMPNLSMGAGFFVTKLVRNS